MKDFHCGRYPKISQQISLISKQCMEDILTIDNYSYLGYPFIFLLIERKKTKIDIHVSSYIFNNMSH